MCFIPTILLIYLEHSIISLVFTYAIREGKAIEKTINTKIQYHNYQHHKLPITMNPLEYGDLIYQMDNKYIIQINKTNVVLITTFNRINDIKLFREGLLVFEYKDHKLNDNTFIRSLNNKKFTFKDNNLIEESIDRSLNNINYNDSNALLLKNNLILFGPLVKKLGIRSFTTSAYTDMKLESIRNRKVNWDTLTFNIENKLWNIDLLQNIFSRFLGVVSPQFTDSFFIDGELPKYLIGDDLGQFKDELNGGWIKKAYFLGIKKYGYIDSLNQTHSVFSGVERNSLTWNEIEQISKGFTIVKENQVRFYKNFSNLNINIKNSLITSIVFNPRKKLLNNKYQPVKFNIKILGARNKGVGDMWMLMEKTRGERRG